MAERSVRSLVIQEGEKRPSVFMTSVVQCTDRMIESGPTAARADETARPQLVRREISPETYAIISEYKKLTVSSCLINTSFNMHVKPIISAPDEAIKAFKESPVDLLMLGPFLVHRAVSSEIVAPACTSGEAELITHCRLTHTPLAPGFSATLVMSSRQAPVCTQMAVRRAWGRNGHSVACADDQDATADTGSWTA